MDEKLDIFEEIAKGNLYFDWTDRLNIIVFSIDNDTHKKEAIIHIEPEKFSSYPETRSVNLTLFSNKYYYFGKLLFQTFYCADKSFLQLTRTGRDLSYIAMNRCNKDIISSSMVLNFVEVKMMKYYESRYDKIIDDLRKENNMLWEKINELWDKMEEIWYMPGAPGYVSANNNFSSLAIKQ